MKFKKAILIFSFWLIGYSEANNLTNDVGQKQRMQSYSDCKEVGKYLDQEICLEKDYLKEDAPDKTNMVVYLEIHRFVVREIDDEKKTLSFDFLLGMKWSDPRIKANFSSSEKEKDIRHNIASMVIWKPDLSLRRLTDRKAMDDSIDVKTFRLFPTATNQESVVGVELMVGGRIACYCYWELEMYPLDNQECTLTFYAQGSSKIFFIVSSFGHPKYHDLNEDYIGAGFEISTTMKTNASENNFELSLKLSRIFQPFLFKYYLPTIIIVVISGLGFLFPLTVLPGRITLGVTQFLTLTNLFIHQMVRNF